MDTEHCSHHQAKTCHLRQQPKRGHQDEAVFFQRGLDLFERRQWHLGGIIPASLFSHRRRQTPSAQHPPVMTPLFSKRAAISNGRKESRLGDPIPKAQLESMVRTTPQPTGCTPSAAFPFGVQCCRKRLCVALEEIDLGQGS